MIDVCLILEGTYPYVTGGVSSAVHQLITKTPNINYGICYIGAYKSQCTEYKYPIPANVKFMDEVFLYDFNEPSSSEKLKKGDIHQEDVNQLFDIFFNGNFDNILNVHKNFFAPNTRVINPVQLFSSKEIWHYLIENYQKSFPDKKGPSFIDYFYNWRFSFYPIFKVMEWKLPPAKVYHTLCTGFAGLSGVIAKLIEERPLIVSEHGIYTHERFIEISQASWLHNTDTEFKVVKNNSFFKNWWINIFTKIGELSYHYSDDITSLFIGNANKQISLGAAKEKISIIPKRSKRRSCQQL